MQTQEIMRQFILFILFVFSPYYAFPNVGDIFSAKIAEGIDMNFKVISETEKTCQVGSEKSYEPAISTSYTGPVTIPSSVNGYSVISIGNYAFLSCQLSSISIPNSVLHIGGSAFDNCLKMQKIEIGRGLAFFSDNAFRMCSSLSSIIIDKENTVYDSRDNCNAIIETKTNTLLLGCQNTLIPSTVTSIGPCAFEYCNNLETIVIPGTVSYIGLASFWACSNLSAVTINNGVKSISKQAFGACYNLSSITIPNSITSIGMQAFQGCMKLEKVISEIENPFDIRDDVFMSVSNKAVLSVPQGTKSLYQSLSGWSKYFSTIIERGSNDDSHILTITSVGNGTVSYSNNTIRENTSSFTIYDGTSATISFNADNGYRIKSVKVNSSDMTSGVSNNQYTVSNIQSNTTVEVEFEKESVSGIQVNEANFPDNAFRSWIINNISGASDSFLSEDEINTVESIDCVGSYTNIGEIRSLKGIELFQNLTELHCGYNQIVELDVSKNSKLRVLHCKHNKISNLKLNSGNVLEQLYCSDNLLEQLNVSQTPRLVFLECSDNYLCCIDLSGNKSLYSIFLSKQLLAKELHVISNELAILVPMEFDFTKVSSLKCDDKDIDARVTINDGKKYLIFSSSLTELKNKKITYLYATGSTRAGNMEVEINVSYDSSSIFILNVSTEGPGSVIFNGMTIKNESRQSVMSKGESTNLSFVPDDDAKIKNVRINNSDVTSKLTNNSYSISNINSDTSVEVEFESILPTTYTLSIKATGNGSASYDGNTIRSKTGTFTVNGGSSAAISFNPDNGYRVKSVKVNSSDVTSNLSNNKYTISNINKNTNVEVEFQEELKTFTSGNLNYAVLSYDDKTVSLANGKYGTVLEVPATITYQDITWKVAGIDNAALANNEELAAIIWNPSAAFNVSVSNPNLLLYVKSASYAPATIQNVVVNSTAESIVLTDAASGNNFYCPKEFTAKKISYTHNYGMITGLGESRGWETIALPFDVKKIAHSSKGELTPFANWRSGDSKKPFWLMSYGTGGWTNASSIKANTPYIISMPNNQDYKSEFRLSGNITFSSENVTVKKSDNLQTGNYGGNTFTPNFSNSDNSGYLTLNVNNDYVSYSGGSAEGSTFVVNLRPVHPFEAYMTSTSKTRSTISINGDMATGIEDMSVLMDESMGLRIYNLKGQLIKVEQDKSLDEVRRSLPAGVYIINGKKLIIK